MARVHQSRVQVWEVNRQVKCDKWDLLPFCWREKNSRLRLRRRADTQVNFSLYQMKRAQKQLGFAFWQVLLQNPHQHLNAVFYLLQIFSNQCQIFTAGASDRCSLVGYLSRDISHCKVVPLRCQYTFVRLFKHRELQCSQLLSTCRQIYNSERRKVSRSFSLPNSIFTIWESYAISVLDSTHVTRQKHFYNSYLNLLAKFSNISSPSDI